MQRIRVVTRTLSLPLALSLALASAAQLPGPSVRAADPAAVEGAGWDTAACVGCIATGLMIAAGGAVAVLAAANMSGSAMAAAACAYSCARAIS